MNPANLIQGSLSRRPSLFWENKSPSKNEDGPKQSKQRPSIKLQTLSTFQIPIQNDVIPNYNQSDNNFGGLHSVIENDNHNKYEKTKIVRNDHKKGHTTYASRTSIKTNETKNFTFSKNELVPGEDEIASKNLSSKSKISREKHSRTSSNDDQNRRSIIFVNKIFEHFLLLFGPLA